MYDHLTSISEAMNGLGWGNYANDHEDAAGQFEQNFNYADALTTADRVITLRYILNILAEQRGMTATFMPKPFSDRTGTGLHFHLSLWSGGGRALPRRCTDDGGRGLGLSGLAYSFIGGLLEHAPALQAFLAPTVNSYKRSGATTSSSGATWSPRKASFGGNDRTHMIRVPDNKRIELRSGDGSANPYLAIATALAAGLDGVARDADPGLPSGPGECTARRPPPARHPPARRRGPAPGPGHAGQPQRRPGDRGVLRRRQGRGVPHLAQPGQRLGNPHLPDLDLTPSLH